MRFYKITTTDAIMKQRVSMKITGTVAARNAIKRMFKQPKPPTITQLRAAGKVLVQP